MDESGMDAPGLKLCDLSVALVVEGSEDTTSVHYSTHIKPVGILAAA